jgi:hypothetical protein
MRIVKRKFQKELFISGNRNHHDGSVLLLQLKETQKRKIMYSDETYHNFTYDDLKQLTSKRSMFIVLNNSSKHSHQLTAIQYLLKINLLFMHALNNNN